MGADLTGLEGGIKVSDTAVLAFAAHTPHWLGLVRRPPGAGYCRLGC